MKKYNEAIEHGTISHSHLTHLVEVYKELIRHVTSEVFMTSHAKQKSGPVPNIGVALVSVLQVISITPEMVKSMVFTHSWALFDSWVDSVLNCVCQVHYDHIKDKFQVSLKDFDRFENLEEMKLDYIKEYTEAYTMKGTIAKLTAIEKLVNFPVFQSSDEQGRLEKMRDIRNCISHGRKIKGIPHSELDDFARIFPEEMKIGYLPNKYPIICIRLQLSIINRMTENLITRENIKD